MRLSDLDHPLVNKARSAPLADLKNALERGLPVAKTWSYSFGQDRPDSVSRWIRVRATGARRGLMCLDRDHFWLGFAEHRSGDYDGFNDHHKRNGSTSYFEPTKADFDRLKLEESYVQEQREQHGRRLWLLNGTLAAWQRGETIVGRGPDDESVEITALNDGGIVEVELRFISCKESAFQQVFEDATAYLAVVSPTEWEPTFDSGPAAPFSLYAVLPPDELDRLVTLAAQHGEDAITGRPQLVAEIQSDGFSHVVTKADQLAGYFNGQVVRGLCGRRFVPLRDYETLPVCPSCADLKGFAVDISTELR